MLKNELGRYFVEVWPVLWQGRCWEGVSSIIRGVAHCNLHSKYIFWGIHSPCSRHHTLATLITLHFVWFIVFKLSTEGLLKGAESMQIVVRVIKMRPQFRCRGKMLSGSKVPTQPVTVRSRHGSLIVVRSCYVRVFHSFYSLVAWCLQTVQSERGHLWLRMWAT